MATKLLPIVVTSIFSLVGCGGTEIPTVEESTASYQAAGRYCPLPYVCAGKVKWEISDPAGEGYQVVPESGGGLKSPGRRGDVQSIDAIYNCKHWPSKRTDYVYKVPTNCTATVHDYGNIDCDCFHMVCSPVSCVFIPNTCEWITPEPGGYFPRCP